MASFFSRLAANRQAGFAASHPELPCPVCGGGCAPFDVADFNKCCEEFKGKFLPLAGIPIYYYRCGSCGFCFAPEIAGWSQTEFAERIYNDDYAQVDPDYTELRPKANAAALAAMFGDHAPSIAHLDYGGGEGLLSELLRRSGWRSVSYDPFAERQARLDRLGKFDLVTAFEVFEHVPDVQQLMANLSSLLAADGVVLFSTLLSDGRIVPFQRLTWWYASPRNGHISLFSRQSLTTLAAHHGFRFGSFSDNFHGLWREIPPWAAHFIRP